MEKSQNLTKEKNILDTEDNIPSNKASDIRTFFGQKPHKSSDTAQVNLRPSQPEQLSQVRGSQKSVKRKKEITENTRHTPVTKRQNKQAVNRRSSARLENKNKRTKAITLSQELELSDTDSSCSGRSALSWDYYFTPPVSRASSATDLSVDKDAEDAFLQHLAKILPTATEEQLGLTPENTSASNSELPLQKQQQELKMQDQSAQSDQERDINPDNEQIMTEATVMKLGADKATEDQLVANMEEQPCAINLEMVYSMFQQLQKDVSDLKRMKVVEDEEAVSKQQEAMNQLDQVFESEKKNIADNTIQIKTNSMKMDVMVQVMDRFETTLNEITARVDNLELNNAKRAIVLTGLHTSGKRDEILNQLYTFLQEELDTPDVLIDDFFTMGLTSPKPVVIYFQNMAEKRIIMQRKSLLKDSSNASACYINDYLPSAAQEKKRREKDIRLSNNKKEKKQEITRVNGQLCLGGHPYRKMVVTPKPSELIQIDPKEVSEILKLPVTRGADVFNQGNIFSSYSATVVNHKQVRDLYVKMKLIQPAARHIVCAYYLPGEPEHNLCDYCDDNEHGAGRALMELLKRQDLPNMVIFIARKYSGVKLGPNRIPSYVEAALNSLQKLTEMNPDGGKKINKELELKLRKAVERRDREAVNTNHDSWVEQQAESTEDVQNETVQKSAWKQDQADHQPLRPRPQRTRPPMSKSKMRGNYRPYNQAYGPVNPSV